jgi:predicted acyl esterase
MRVRTLLATTVAATLAAAASADAAINQVFTDTPSPVACVVQPSGLSAGQRHCTGPTGPYNVSTVPSFDGTPIDVTVTLPPAPSGGTDGNYPVVGVFHGYGGQKFAPSSTTVQRWAGQGYAVLSITDRGFWGSCGVLVPVKTGPCEDGYIRLMDNAYEVRDVQHLLGLLADEGIIDPQRIGASGGSYGGGMSLQLGALKNRVQRPDRSLVPWTSPDGTPMQIAATAPEYTWSDLQSSLQPNGSTLDYAAENPYDGPDGDRRFGVQKQFFSTQLYAGGAAAGWYAPVGSDPDANITAWKGFNDTGGPYDGHPLADEQTAAFPYHGAYYTDISEAPAPALLVNGWNDDLFPVDESIRYYNRVRAHHPDTPIKMLHLNIGHSPRGGGTVLTDYVTALQAENAWFNYYVRGRGNQPKDARGGVTALTTSCAGTATSDGVRHDAANWAALAPGEIRVDGSEPQTIGANTPPAESFQTGTTNACTDGPAADTPGAAVYETDPAPAGGYTIAGSPTVVADLTVTGPNDAVLSRLYDVDPDAGTAKLIARGVYRPTGVGTATQVFQLAPQAYRIAPGHVVKLELLGEDQPFMGKATGQHAVEVEQLELRLPTIEGPGGANGLVQAPAEKLLPEGYTLARDVVQPAEPVPPTPPAPPIGGPFPTPVAPKDPVPWQTVRTALRRQPKSISVARNGSRVTFRETLPEAGTITYGISVRVRSGKRLRTASIGRAKYTRTAAGSFKATIKVSSRGRALLRKHKKASITLRSYFISPVEKHHVNTVRTLKRR